MGAVGILAGRLNDRIGPRVLIAVSAAFLGLGYLLMSRLQYPWQLYVFYGVLFGIILFSGALGGVVGPVMAGQTFDVTGSYRLVILVLSVLTLIGFLLVIWLRPVATGKP
jgi:nitrate/nitrite transporter NarK